MTYHSGYDKPCGCGEYYIPYKEGVRCPSCGAQGEAYDIVGEVLEAYRAHMGKYGMALPPFFVATLGDHYILLGLKYLADPEGFRGVYRSDAQRKFWEGYFSYLGERFSTFKSKTKG